MLLLVSDAPSLRAQLVSRLSEHGIYTFQCPFETAEFFCDKKDTGGVLLDCKGALTRGEQLCARLHEKYPDMPICAILAPLAVPDLAVNRLIRETGDVFDDVLDFCIRTCGWKTARLTTHALTVGSNPESIFYMGYRLSLTPSEYTLLRCLFYRSPRVTSARDLLSLCFPGRRISVTNVTTHISNINKRAAELDPRPLIVNVHNQGYRLRDGIV